MTVAEGMAQGLRKLAAKVRPVNPEHADKLERDAEELENR